MPIEAESKRREEGEEEEEAEEGHAEASSSPSASPPLGPRRPAAMVDLSANSYHVFDLEQGGEGGGGGGGGGQGGGQGGGGKQQQPRWSLPSPRGLPSPRTLFARLSPRARSSSLISPRIRRMVRPPTHPPTYLVAAASTHPPTYPPTFFLQGSQTLLNIRRPMALKTEGTTKGVEEGVGGWGGWVDRWGYACICIVAAV